VTVPAPVVVLPAEFGAIEPRVQALEERSRAADGHASLNESVWRDLEQPAPTSAGFLVDDVAYGHVAPSDTFTPQHWALGTTVAPEARASGARSAIVAGAQHHVRDNLPIAERPAIPPGFELRDFEVGRDETAWLVVNNRAFENHAEQGGWIEATLARRMAEPWFDPSLFLLAFDADGLAGFNWLKIHDAHGRDPKLGEIFVIGVDPRTQGTGLGRALALLGLQRLFERGITTGSLFVAAENAPGLKLYRALGFDIHRVDRAYECEVPTR
jgi:ribosomal protein S18 acetylase RimI-like enzyme